MVCDILARYCVEMDVVRMIALLRWTAMHHASIRITHRIVEIEFTPPCEEGNRVQRLVANFSTSNNYCCDQNSPGEKYLKQHSPVLKNDQLKKNSPEAKSA